MEPDFPITFNWRTESICPQPFFSSESTLGKLFYKMFQYPAESSEVTHDLHMDQMPVWLWLHRVQSTLHKWNIKVRLLSNRAEQNIFKPIKIKNHDLRSVSQLQPRIKYSHNCDVDKSFSLNLTQWLFQVVPLGWLCGSKLEPVSHIWPFGHPCLTQVRSITLKIMFDAQTPMQFNWVTLTLKSQRFALFSHGHTYVREPCMWTATNDEAQ